MSRNYQIKPKEIVVQLPDGRISTMFVDPHLNKLVAPIYDANQDIMRHWFEKKFYANLSDIRTENHGYYKHYVHNFVTHFFSEEKIVGKKILDFGCGPGFYSAIFAQRGANVIGIDLNQFLIEKANEHKDRLGLRNVDFVQADLLTYSSHWNNKEFDYIIAIDTVVSFDYNKEKHSHERVSNAFSCISRILKDNGRFFIIESHPFFGKIIQEIKSDTEEDFCIRSSDYKIEYKLKGDPHHWFTLDEMTRATSENGLAILRIYEPDPSIDLKHLNAKVYSFRLKYPGMIVYEICKII